MVWKRNSRRKEAGGMARIPLKQPTPEVSGPRLGEVVGVGMKGQGKSLQSGMVPTFSS